MLHANLAGNEFHWFLDGVLLSGQTSETIQTTQNGIYTVEVVDGFGCESMLSEPFHFIYVGLKEIENQFVVRVFPNPSNGQFFLQFTEKTGAVKIQVRSIQGQEISKLEFSTAPTLYKMDLSSFPSGVYWIEILSAQKIQTVKIILE